MLCYDLTSLSPTTSVYVHHISTLPLRKDGIDYRIVTTGEGCSEERPRDYERCSIVRIQCARSAQILEENGRCLVEAGKVLRMRRMT